MANPLSLAQAVIDTSREVFGWWVSESGRIEAEKRAALRAKKKECQRALANNDWSALAMHCAELERLSNEA